MSADAFVAKEGDGHIAALLADGVRLLDGAVAAAYVPITVTDCPVVWATISRAELGSKLGTLATDRLANGGPWGGVGFTGWNAWLEPVPQPDGEDENSQTDGTSLAGVLAVAFCDRSSLTGEDVEKMRTFARFCRRTAHPSSHAEALATVRRIDDLVSQISERLMSTTQPTLQTDLDWAIETLCKFLGADTAFLRRNDHLAGTSVLMAEYPRRGVPLEDDPLGVVPFDSDPLFAATRDLKMPLIVRNALNQDERYVERVKEATGDPADFAEYTGAGVPLVSANVTEGCLAFVYMRECDWTESEVNALRAVAALLVQLLHRVDAEERLRHNALTDELTGLANRRALLAELAGREPSEERPLALLFIDLDRFKVMNDHLGHSTGDKVLQVIADRIRTSLRPADFAARLGGDEFVVIIDDVGGGLGAAAAANRLLDVISLPIDVAGQRIAHTGSVGIALCENPGTTGQQLLGQADIALYAAKSQGRNRTVVFDQELEATVAQRSSTELQLRQALAQQALTLVYQPEFDLRSGEMLAMEALVRWQREGRLIEAGQFIPVAEETYLITDIDRWVLEEACNQLAAWRRKYPDLDVVIRVNMSPAQLAVNGLVRTVADCLRLSGLPPELLCLEITEQAVIGDVDQAVRVLHDIRSMGVKLAIDDFGTGFSSMVQLKSLPVDVLKVDRVFVHGIAKDPTDQAIVETIVRLARAFQLDVVGEGVERVADLETLVRLGCVRAQGFLLSYPLPPSQLEELLTRRRIDLQQLANAVVSH